MKRVTVLLVFWLLLSSTAAAQETVVVAGVVTDFLTGAPVPQALVVLETTAGKQTVLSAMDGWYVARLPVDVYRVGVQRMTYCSVHRAAAHIRSDTRFDFTLPACPTEHVGISVNGRYAGEEAREVNPFKYESFNVRSELLLRFGTKLEEQGFIAYNGTKLKHSVREGNSKEVKDAYAWVGVMLTYESLTVYADKVKLEKESFEIEAQGNVIVEDGSTRTKAETVRLKLRGDKPLIAVIR